MHPEIVQDKPGNCPKCGMKLVNKEEIKAQITTYTPLIIIFGLIFLTTVVVAANDARQSMFSLKTSMADFMAGFFLVFAGFKMLDLKGFAQGYASYDLIAQRSVTYGYVYPFIELFLGFLYLTKYDLVSTNIVTIIVMGVSGAGVIKNLMAGKKFQCACLGTFIKVPLTSVTLFEDFGMALMAALMLLI